MSLRFSGTFTFPFDRIAGYVSQGQTPRLAVEEPDNKALLEDRYARLQPLFTMDALQRSAPEPRAWLSLEMAKEQVALGSPYPNGYPDYTAHRFSVTRSPLHDADYTRRFFKEPGKPPELYRLPLKYPKHVDAVDEAIKRNLAANGFVEGQDYLYEFNEDNTAGVARLDAQNRSSFLLD